MGIIGFRVAEQILLHCHKPLRLEHGAQAGQQNRRGQSSPGQGCQEEAQHPLTQAAQRLTPKQGGIAQQGVQNHQNDQHIEKVKAAYRAVKYSQQKEPAVLFAVEPLHPQKQQGKIQHGDGESAVENPGPQPIAGEHIGHRGQGPGQGPAVPLF